MPEACLWSCPDKKKNGASLVAQEYFFMFAGDELCCVVVPCFII